MIKSVNRARRRNLVTVSGSLLMASTLAIALATSGCSSGSNKASASATVSQPTAPAAVDTVSVISQRLDITVPLPGELQPYE
ncbi:MAG: hypothetical protein ACRD28_05700, partial [Acidobacteriaceae bacterium]